MAVARLKSRLARSLAGGDDPCEDSEALELLDLIEREAPRVFDPERLRAFAATMRDPSLAPGISRRVVLARGQRLLLSLAIAIEDSPRESAAPARGKEAGRERAGVEPEATPFDRALLDLRGVGPKTAARLASRGLTSPLDVLFWLPRRYDDRRSETPIAELRPGLRVVTSGEVAAVKLYGHPRRRIMEMVIAEGEARVSAIWFSNRRPRRDRFAKGDRLTLAGLVGRYRNRLQIAHPVVVSDGDGGDRVGRVVPVYGEVPGVPGRTVEKAVRSAAERAAELVRDPIPAGILRRRGLMPLADALAAVHLPPERVTTAELDEWVAGRSPAHRRLAYDEFFYTQLGLAIRRREISRGSAPRIETHGGDLARETCGLLGFEPTGAQRRVTARIAADLEAPAPMRRLLQGDVGSGKTAVALAAVLAAVRSGCQAALMAPTEILAEQHMRTLEPALRKLGIRAALHLGAARSSARRKALAGFESGRVQLAIGTHALIQQSVGFAALGLAVVDEQHRFGVAQRLGLVGKGPRGTSPNLLVMTATPIPRSLALTLHGDLDVSLLDELPPGRLPVETRRWSPDDWGEALRDVERALAAGEQAYVVCPLIEESESVEAPCAEQVFEQLRERYGEDRVGLLHGRLPPERRDEVMDAFAAGRLGLLVTTTVIEVGVDVPRATVMLVLGAERFGLAQLHQLRGRVGRSRLPSRCHLVADPTSGEAASRIEVLARTGDGFAVAEADLSIRGPGELYGRRQAGLPDLRFGDLSRDADLLLAAREDVGEALAAESRGEGAPLDGLRAELARRIEAGRGPVGEESG